MSRTTCKLCQEPLEPRLGTGGSGRSGEVAVELGPYLARTCPVGHFRHFPAPGFGGALRDGIAAALPVGEVCPECGTGSSAAESRLDLSVPVPQGEPAPRAVQVGLDAPVHACGCGASWISTEVAEHLDDALVAAFLGLRP